jgi:hypothetical protein
MAIVQLSLGHERRSETEAELTELAGFPPMRMNHIETRGTYLLEWRFDSREDADMFYANARVTPGVFSPHIT